MQYPFFVCRKSESMTQAVCLEKCFFYIGNTFQMKPRHVEPCTTTKDNADEQGDSDKYKDLLFC